jgi:hypothetical protein
MLYPHPAEQFDGPGVFVSDFVDVGRPTVMEAEAGDIPLFFRTAHHTRSFRISSPWGKDREVINWRRVPKKPFEIRRFVQFAAQVPRPKGEGQALIELRWKQRPSVLLWFLIVSGLGVAWLKRHNVKRGSREAFFWVRRHAAPIGAVLLALIATALLWNTEIHLDELVTVSMARRVLISKELILSKFIYPHILTYLQVLGTVAYGIISSISGIFYHDPYSNQLYYDGRLVDLILFHPENYPSSMLYAALPWIRRGYAVTSALMIMLAYVVARRAGSTRSGFFAAMAVAVQPLLMKAQILPNAPGATLALGAACAFLIAPATFGWTLVKGCFAGALIAWKFNPSFGVVLVGLVLLEGPASTRLSRLAVALVGVPLGFLVVYPSTPWHLAEFMNYLAREAHHYAWGGHWRAEVDAPIAAVLQGIFIRPQLPGNYLVLVLALIGATALLRRWSQKDTRSASWVLLATPILATWFLWGQMVQIGRNYTIPLVFMCVLSGLGSDKVIGLADRHRRGRRVLATALLIGLGSIGVQWWWGIRLDLNEPTARQKAIAWVNENAPLGARITVVEDSGRLQGVAPDRSRFRVREVQSKKGQKRSDYLIVAEGMETDMAEAPLGKYRFTGRAQWGKQTPEWFTMRAEWGTKETYTVYVFAPPDPRISPATRE